MKYMLVAIAFLFCLNALSQNTNPVELTRQYLQEEKYDLAFTTIKNYNAINENFWTLWLLGTAAHAQGKYVESRNAYERAISIKKNNDELRLDYANKLVERKLLAKAKEVLGGIQNEEAIYYQNRYLLAQILYWETSYTKAEQELEAFLKAFPNNQEARYLQSDIVFAKNYKLGITPSYRIDNQPIHTIMSEVGVSKYRSEWLRPKFVLGHGILTADSLSLNTLKFSIGNSVQFPVGIYLNASFGAYVLPGDQLVLIANAGISKSFYNRLKLSVNYNRDRYLYTIGSLGSLVVYDDITPSLAYTNHYFEINLNTNWRLYNDDNTCLSIGGWTLIHLLNKDMIKFNVGYSYSRSQSDFDSFGPIKSIGEIMGFYHSPDYAYGDTPEVEGDYLTYYTPHKQEIHSALANVIYKPIKALTLSVTGSYGFSAIEDTPFLYLDAEENGDAIITKEYTPTNFTPQSLDCKLDWQIKKHIGLNISYRYSKPNIYYNSQTIAAGLSLSF